MVVIAKDGNLIHFCLKIAPDSPQSFSLTYHYYSANQSLRSDGTLFSFTNNQLAISSTNDLHHIKEKIGLSAMDETRLFFYLWRYCLSNPKIPYNEAIAKIICGSWKQSVELANLFVLPSTTTTTPQSENSTMMEQEAEEDIDIL